jgi:hypothetical protein
VEESLGLTSNVPGLEMRWQESCVQGKGTLSMSLTFMELLG